MATDAPVFTQQTKHDRSGGTNGLERLDPARQIVAAGSDILLEPVMIGGQIEFADATGDRRALLDRHQPFVFAQVRARLARLREQMSARCIDFVEQNAQRFVIDLRIAPKRSEQLFLALELLQNVVLHIGACRHVRNIEERQQRRMMIGRRILRGEEARARKQGLEPYQRADTLVQWMFVADHGIELSSDSAAEASWR